MKSYFLAAFKSEVAASEALASVFVGQDESSTKVLFLANNPAAYFYVGKVNNPDEFEGAACNAPVIQADIGGTYYNEDARIIEVLKRLQGLIGGAIFNDDGVKVG